VANRIVAIPMALSELQGPVPIASLCEYDFSYSCTAVDKISTDLERRAVPLRQPSLVRNSHWDWTQQVVFVCERWPAVDTRRRRLVCWS